MADFGSPNFANVAMGTQAAQAGSSVLNGVTQSNAIKAQSIYDQQSANLTAQDLDLRARDAEHRGANDVSLIGRAAERLKGTQVARYAGQGVEVNTGAALDAQMETDQMSEMDKLVARNNAGREAYGYRSTGAGVRSGASLQALAARGAARSTLLQGYQSGGRDLMLGAYQYNQMQGLEKDKKKGKS